MKDYIINFLPWIAVFAIFWFLFIRPQRKKQQEHQEMVDKLEVGDEVITIGGIKGEVSQINSNGFKLKIAPEVEIEVVKNSIGQLAVDKSDEDE
ncbi:MAG: preprotein translocase subunit YajC [Bacillota bacterium]